MSERIAIVSNRLPVNFSWTEENGEQANRSAGGLATGLEKVHKESAGLWFGFHPTDERFDLDFFKEKRLYPIDIEPDLYEKYYGDFSNGVLWPLFHYFPDYMHFTNEGWQAYKKVNQIFAEKVLENTDENDRIWIHDYQLMLLPSLIRKERPTADIAFFNHIPFPSSEVFRVLPVRTQMLDGILGANLIGFHTYDYARHFLSSVAQLTPHSVFMEMVNLEHHQATVRTHPLGIAAGEWADLSKERELATDDEFGNRVVFLGIDRLDYTKGIRGRLEAFMLFLERNSELLGKVCFVQLVVPSREHVFGYDELKQELERLTGEINGRFGSPGYSPVEYIYRALPREEVVGLYKRADVMVVTPLRDGLNLVAKEYIASRFDGRGSLILSEFAGAASEMGEALIVNPFDPYSVCKAMERAVHMSDFEKEARMKALRSRVMTYTNLRWAANFVEDWSVTRSSQDGLLQQPLLNSKKELLQRVAEADRVFVFCDYDGTLHPIVKDPESAVLDADSIQSLQKIMSRTNFCIITGRGRDFVERKIQPLDCDYATEHGLFIRYGDEPTWRMSIESESTEHIKSEVRHLLQLYGRSIPGTFIEEKEASIVWHYRNAPKTFSQERVLLIRAEIAQRLGPTPFSVYDGKKVLDIRHASVNKGAAMLEVLKHYDFSEERDVVLTIGDDITDEAMFAELCDSNVSIGVGSGLKAKYMVPTVDHVYQLFEDLYKAREGK